MRPDSRMRFSAHMEHRTRWTVAAQQPAAAELASRLRVSAVIAQVLLNRGISEDEECRRFLQPSLKCLHDPGSLPNLNKAAARVAAAIRGKQKIVIYGDYDVDGITATAILWHAIKILGGNVDFYIPHRIDEGYGLNSDAIRQICDSGAKVIITFDCGVTAIDQATIAAERGVDLIITDHHEWREGQDKEIRDTRQGDTEQGDARQGDTRQGDTRQGDKETRRHGDAESQ